MGSILNSDNKYSHINTLVSIGTACRTRYQIEKFMSKRIDFLNFWTGSNYFDYLMGGGVAGVANVISREFEIQPAYIELANINNKFIPKDRLSNHLFLHDFGDSWWNSNFENSVTELNVHMEKTIQKYQYLGKKTNSLLKSDQSVALVYHGKAPDDQWNKLKETIIDNYGKEIPIINILELNQKESIIDGAFFTLFINDDNSPKKGLPSEWQGWDESWFSAFSSLDILKID